MSHQLILKNNTPTIQDYSSYVQYAMRIPNLNIQEERHLLEDFKINNNLQSAQSLVLSQLKTVVKIVNGYKNYGLPAEDLAQEGNIGLMKAVKNYDLSQDVRLYSYAIVWIKAEIQNYILKNWKMVKIATTKNLKKLFFNFRKTQKEMIEKGISKSETYKYVSKKLNVPESDVKEIESYFINEDHSIAEDFSGDDDDIQNYQIQLIEHNSPDKIVEKSHDLLVHNKSLNKGLESLNEKQKAVIQMRFFEDEKKTHKEIAQTLKISSERVRQIEVEALTRLKGIVIN
jgi:RNA polymerase sigma-32 factor